MQIEEMLGGRLNLPDVKRLAVWATESSVNRRRLWSLVHHTDGRIAVNSLWVMTHLPASERKWLASLQDDMIDMLLCERGVAKKRLLLQLLREQDFGKESIRTGLLDYCLSKINSECEPYAIRCFSIYVAFNLCRHYPELIAELEGHLDMMSGQSLSPGLKSALRQTRRKIENLRRKR